MLIRPRLVRSSLAAAALALVTGLLSVAGATSASAAGNGSWAVTPTPSKGVNAPRNYFILEGNPGDVIRDSVRIQNFTKKPITFNVYGADGFNTEDSGFFALRAQNHEMVDLGQWIDPVIDQMEVPGGHESRIPIRVRIPDNATPGDHVGGVVAVNTRAEAGAGGSMDVRLQRAIGARVYVRVSGTTSPGIEVSDVEVTHDRGAWPWSGSGKGTVSWTVRNTGNLRLSPMTSIEVTGIGKDTSIEPPALGDLLPGSQVRLSADLSGVDGIGKVDVVVAVDAGEGLTRSETVTLWIVPWAAVVLLLLAAAALGAWQVRRSGVLPRKLRAAEAAPRLLVEADQERS